MFPTPDYSTLRAALLRDIANQLPEAATGSDSDFAIRANAVAAALEGLYQHQQWIVRQILPDTADADYLERWASLFNINRKVAVSASGTITFTAATNGAIAIGTEAKTPDGVAFVTTAGGLITAGASLTLAACAVVPGITGNIAANTALTLTAAPAGVNSGCVVATAMTGGMDVELDAALLSRLLARLRNPPHGGNASDYLAWALAVPGVTEAYVYPMRRGLGTVDVVIEGANGSLPSAQLIIDTQAAINAVKPVTASCLVLGPVLVPVAITATLTLSGTTLATATTAINAALATYFAQLKPGDSVIKTRIAALIADTTGVVDFNLTAPAANVATLVNANAVQLASLGVVTLN
ncbi:MAG: baseplate J/gp47 family protein [Nitrosomonadales bacterium]